MPSVHTRDVEELQESTDNGRRGNETVENMDVPATTTATTARRASTGVCRVHAAGWCAWRGSWIGACKTVLGAASDIDDARGATASAPTCVTCHEQNVRELRNVWCPVEADLSAV